MAGDRKLQKIGVVGRLAAANVRLAREAQGLSYAELARRTRGTLTEISLRRIEQFERRIDVDDLWSLTEALGVGDPTALLTASKDIGAPRTLAGAQRQTELPDIPSGQLEDIYSRLERLERSRG